MTSFANFKKYFFGIFSFSHSYQKIAANLTVDQGIDEGDMSPPKNPFVWA